MKCVLNHSLSWSKFVDTHLYHYRQWSNIHVYFGTVLVSSVPLPSIFTALHGMQTRSSDENSVCPSVKRVDCDKTEERSVQIVIPHERPITLVFLEEEWLVRCDDPFYLKF